MKPDFEKWYNENYTKKLFKLDRNQIANEFAEDFAKKEVIEYVMFSEGCSRKEAEEYYNFNIHQIFKDES